MNMMQMRFPFLLFALMWVACHSTPALPVPGEFDRTFGQNGIANFPTDAGSVAYFVTTDPAGRVAVTGKDRGNEFLARLQANGVLDTSFNGAGFVRGTAGTIDRFGDTLLGHTGQWISNLVGGQMLATRVDITSCRPEICRFRSQTIRARRFNAEGSLVSAANGDVEVMAGFRPTQVVEQSDGGSLYVTTVAALVSSQTLLARTGANGLVDTTFRANIQAGNTCPSLARDAFFGSDARALALPDGKTLLAQYIGLFNTPNGTRVCVSRLNPDGTPDKTYAVGGDLILDSPPFSTAVHRPVGVFATGNGGAALVLQQIRQQPDSKQYVIVWLTAQGSLDTARIDRGITGPTELQVAEVTVAAMQRDGNIVIAGYPAIRSTDPNVAQQIDYTQPRVGRLTTQGNSDITFGTGGQGYLALISFGKRLIPNHLHISEDGSIFIAGATTDIGTSVGTDAAQFAVAKLQGGSVTAQPVVTQSNGGGGGCGIARDSRVDPMLPGLAMLALLGLWARRRTAANKT